MQPIRARCLILGCGNTLRGDDGVGPWLCAWAERRLCSEPGVRVIARQQWTPELAEDVAAADAVVFIDCSIESASRIGSARRRLGFLRGGRAGHSRCGCAGVARLGERSLRLRAAAGVAAYRRRRLHRTRRGIQRAGGRCPGERPPDAGARGGAAVGLTRSPILPINAHSRQA